MNFCPTHPPTPSVCSTFLIVSLNFVPEPKSSRETALDVFTARGSWEDINLFFFLSLSFGCKRQHYHAEGFPLLPALFSPAPRCLHVLRSAFWWWNLFPFFTPCSCWVFFPPWYTSNTALIWRNKTKQNKKSCCILHSRRIAARFWISRVSDSEMKTNYASLCQKIEEYMQKMRVND